MKVEVTNPLRSNITKVGKKVNSISVSFFIGLKNYILDLFNNLYIKRTN